MKKSKKPKPKKKISSAQLKAALESSEKLRMEMMESKNKVESELVVAQSNVARLREENKRLVETLDSSVVAMKQLLPVLDSAVEKLKSSIASNYSASGEAKCQD